MGDKSPKNMKKRALRVAQQVAHIAGPAVATSNIVADAVAKPPR